MIDIAIVGDGPAGWSCAITARMRGLQVQVITPENTFGWLKTAKQIDNYPGMPEVSGAKMLEVFEKQALDLGAEKMHGLVRQIMPSDQSFLLLVENEVVEAKNVVLAMGAARPKLLTGEEALVGQGVSYCATCDGMFYRQKKIAVLSETETGAHESQFLASLVAQMDYYPIKQHERTNVPTMAQIIDERPTQMERTDGQIALTTKETTRTYDGIFVFRAAMPLGMLLSTLKTEGSFIPVDRNMATNINGVYAAGDCTGQPLQIAKAVGEGNIAAISIANQVKKLA